jgi:hypothetical protein
VADALPELEVLDELERDGGEVEIAFAVVGTIGEAVCAKPVLLRSEAEAAVGVLGERAVLWAGDDDCCEGVAIGIGVVGEHVDFPRAFP